MKELQNTIENDDLAVDRNGLIEFNNRSRTNIDYINECQLGFINDNPNLTFEEILIIKKFADYMKSR